MRDVLTRFRTGYDRGRRRGCPHPTPWSLTLDTRADGRAFAVLRCEACGQTWVGMDPAGVVRSEAEPPPPPRVTFESSIRREHGIPDA